MSDQQSPGLRGSTVVALVLAQVGLHGCLNGVRMSIPLQAVGQGYSPGLIGLLMALFAVFPVLFALPAGRLADRRGYHFPVRIALSLCCVGAVVASLSQHVWGLGLAAALTGLGSAVGMITLQRTGGRLARDPVQRLRIFSWIALAPSIAQFLGPMIAGTLIDHVGFQAAFWAMALLPLITLTASFWVPDEHKPQGAAASSSDKPSSKGPAWDLLKEPDFRRLLFINWLIAATWDAHSFALPILGHQRGLSATMIGTVLATYAITSASVRALLPMLAHRISQRQMVAGALGMTAVMFATYPLLSSAWAMAACAGILGLGLGAIQPGVMSLIHQVTPHERHGEALGLRSTLIHGSTLVMPLVFGGLGGAMGIGMVFWLTSAAQVLGAKLASGLREQAPQAERQA